MWFQCPCDEFKALWVCAYSVLIDEFNEYWENTKEMEKQIKKNFEESMKNNLKQIRKNIIKI